MEPRCSHALTVAPSTNKTNLIGALPVNRPDLVIRSRDHSSVASEHSRLRWGEALTLDAFVRATVLSAARLV
jgi:hypothetical protein